MNLKPKAVWLKCRKGCKFRYVILCNSDGLVEKFYRANSLAGFQDQPTLVTVDQSHPWAFCIAHHDIVTVKPIKASSSGAICSRDCEEATGDTCKCSCDGMNHGIFA